MSTPRVGGFGAGTTKGDLYVVLANGEVERLGVGADDEVLTADSSTLTGLAYKSLAAVVPASVQADAVDAVFTSVNLGGGAISNPVPVGVGTHALLAFDPDTLLGIPWQLHVPSNYTTGNNLDVTLSWVSDGTDTGNALWGVAIERNNAGFVITADGFAAATTGADAGPGVVGEVVETTITVTGAALDGVAAGEPFRLFVQRDGAAGGDTLTDNAQLLRAVVEEVV